MAWPLQEPVKRAAKRIMSRLGYTALRTRHIDTLYLARHLARLFDLYRVDCVFDIGANTGQYGAMLREHVGYRGLIVSVEPVAAHAAALRTAASGDPGWWVFQLALGATPGRLEINVARAGDFTSFLTPDSSRVDRFAEQSATLRTEAVDVVTFATLLDKVRERGAAASSVYLKLDTQGYDLEVLKGAAGSLGSVQALQIEAAVQPLYRDMPDYRTMLAELEARGFALSAMFPVSHDARLRLIEFDCLFVRDGVAAALA